VNALEFKKSATLTLGVELELQLVNTRDCDLTRSAPDLLELIGGALRPGAVKPEIADSMIELSTSIHSRHEALLAELRALRDAVLAAGDRLNVAVAGGGAHPFQRWGEQRLSDRAHFRRLSEIYGDLARRVAVFGQHIHVGCPDGDDALYLLHALSRYVPHFIALAASSPYYQGVDSAFDSARLNSVSVLPLSGRAPFILRWDSFNAYFARMRDLGVVESMQDFYWDVRPKPEYGTIEIRVCDTPLTVERAAALAAYAQALCRYLLIERSRLPTEDVYLAYGYGRFQACRFGLDGELIDAATGAKRTIAEDVLATVAVLEVHARELEGEDALGAIAAIARGEGNDARWMRERYRRNRSLPDLVFRQVERWRGTA